MPPRRGAYQSHTSAMRVMRTARPGSRVRLHGQGLLRGLRECLDHALDLLVGVPVVAMRDSGVSDFVADGESGLLATSDSGFTHAVQRLATDRALREAIRDHNRHVPPAQGWDASLREHAAVYSLALSGKAQAS